MGMTCDDNDAGFVTLSNSRKENLTQRLKGCLVLVFDERSMIANGLIGKSERVASGTACEGCGHSSPHTWGGTPVVIVAGDDCQLSAMGECATDILHPLVTHKSDKAILRGRQLWKEFAETACKLPTVRRVSESRQKDRGLLDRVRIGENVQSSDVARLQNLNLTKIEQRHGQQAVEKVKEKAICLPRKNKKRISHNLLCLSQVNGRENPTAVLRSRAHSQKEAKAVRCHFKGKPPPSSLICKGCKVCLRDRGFFPLWGLHNGACGEVIEAVFKKGDSPSNGDLPLHAVVSFPLCRGPVWDANNPKHAPVPMSSQLCQFKCCRRLFCPLDLCFARAMHEFQGLTAGPPEDGKPEHMRHCVTIDPDEKDVEITQTGLFCTAISRGTTLGDEPGLNSAVHFTGPHLARERIQDLTLCKDKVHEHIKVTKRRHWVQHLETNTVVNCRSPDEHPTMNTLKKPFSCELLHRQKRLYCSQ